VARRFAADGELLARSTSSRRRAYVPAPCPPPLPACTGAYRCRLSARPAGRSRVVRPTAPPLASFAASLPSTVLARAHDAHRGAPPRLISDPAERPRPTWCRPTRCPTAPRRFSYDSGDYVAASTSAPASPVHGMATAPQSTAPPTTAAARLALPRRRAVGVLSWASSPSPRPAESRALPLPLSATPRA
jgi:hypothetical protein